MIEPPSADTLAEPAPLDLSRPEQSLLVFTVDTEAGTSRMREPDHARAVEEHVFGEFGDGRRLGIDLHMDLLEEVGFRGCFFVDILLEHQFGRDALERTIEAIGGRGHEMQLHLHSHHLSLSTDPELRNVSRAIYGEDPEPFRRALAHAVDLFTERVGKAPVAYRAGGYNICDAFLAVLPEFGLSIDSSLHPFKNWRVSPWMRTRTQPFRVNGVLEMPVGGMLIEQGRERVWRAFAPHRSGTQAPIFEQRRVKTAPIASVYVSHSYQLLEVHREHDERRGDIVFFGPESDQARTELLREMLAGYAARPGSRSVTFTELSERALHAWDEPATPVDPMPILLSSGQSAIVHMSRHRPHLADAPAVEDQPIDRLLGATLDDWRDKNVLVWCDRGNLQTVRRLLASVDARAIEMVLDTTEEPNECLKELRLAVDDASTLDGALAIDTLDSVHPDDLIDVLQWLHERLKPGGSLALRVSTDLLTERDPESTHTRFCAATYMTAFRRAGFGFERFERTLVDEHDPALRQVRQSLHFHDPLELRTAQLDALLIRPDRIDLADLAFAD